MPCAPASCAWPTARCTAPSCPAFPACAISAATAFTPAAGTTTIPAAGQTAGSTGWATSGWPSSARAPRRFSACPFLGEAAKELYVFQRTPSTVDVRGNSPTDQEWAQSLQLGWQKHRMENFNSLVSGVPQEEDLVDDGWTDLVAKFVHRFQNADPGANMSIPQMVEMVNFEKMEELRGRVDDLVDDAETAEKLKPYYQMFCKRPTFNDEYLPTFNRPNRSPGGHRRQGRGTHHGKGPDGRRNRIRGGLHHLQHRLRGRHRLYAQGRLRRVRPAAAGALSEQLGGRHAQPARHEQPRLSEPVRLADIPSRLHRQLPAPAGGVAPGTRRTSSATRSRTAAPKWR